jgi:hypothetical protein
MAEALAGDANPMFSQMEDVYGSVTLYIRSPKWSYLTRDITITTQGFISVGFLHGLRPSVL